MKQQYWYRKKKVRQVSGFISPEDVKRLKAMADAEDRSLTRYISRLLEKHIREYFRSKVE